MNKDEKIKLEDEYKNSSDIFDIPITNLIEQIELFEKGVPFIRLKKPALAGDGILILNQDEAQKFMELGEVVISEGRVIKFVPASGAASRMFKKLQSVLNIFLNLTLDEIKNKADSGNDDCLAVFEYITNIKKFAFYDDLSEIIKSNNIRNPQWTDYIKFTLEAGLDYSSKPKGSILFHKYGKESRTAFEEHFVEGINYACDNSGTVKIHFTISPEHEILFNKISGDFINKKSNNENRFDVQYSYQKKSTNTIAVNSENKIFRDENGNPVFRPGGHGALLENLSALNGDIIQIKNIDNVAHDHSKDETYRFKKILTGILAEFQKKIFGYINRLESNKLSGDLINEIASFCNTQLSLQFNKKFNWMNNDDKRKYLLGLMTRPIRVCGMVKNEGEPGGGPFWVENNDGSLSLQVVESVQINQKDTTQIKIFNSATHFSPVDFVCGVRDYKGNQFNLCEFSDPDTALITKKSLYGKELKALELPGLWNGGMAKWISIFVEVPLITFNPVKEINDLLRPAHQPVR